MVQWPFSDVSSFWWRLREISQHFYLAILWINFSTNWNAWVLSQLNVMRAGILRSKPLSCASLNVSNGCLKRFEVLWLDARTINESFFFLFLLDNKNVLSFVKTFSTWCPKFDCVNFIWDIVWNVHICILCINELVKDKKKFYSGWLNHLWKWRWLTSLIIWHCWPGLSTESSYRRTKHCFGLSASKLNHTSSWIFVQSVATSL